MFRSARICVCQWEWHDRRSCCWGLQSDFCRIRRSKGRDMNNCKQLAIISCVKKIVDAKAGFVVCRNKEMTPSKISGCCERKWWASEQVTFWIIAFAFWWGFCDMTRLVSVFVSSTWSKLHVVQASAIVVWQNAVSLTLQGKNWAILMLKASGEHKLGHCDSCENARAGRVQNTCYLFTFYVWCVVIKHQGTQEFANIKSSKK